MCALQNHDRTSATSTMEERPPSIEASPATEWRVEVLHGALRIIQRKDALVKLSERCGQIGAMEHLEYFLQRPKFVSKIPCLILFRPQDADDLAGAILLYQYKALGVGCRTFVADYHAGDRTVIAPPELRARFASLGCAELLRRGALVVQLTYQVDPNEMPGQGEDSEQAQQCMRQEGKGPKGKGPRGSLRWRWASGLRKMHGHIPIAATYDETLAGLGKHTRRNMRASRRQAEMSLGYSFVTDPVMTKEEFLELDRISTHPVTNELAAWRFDAMKLLSGCLFLGIKDSKGEWLSVIGGRRHSNGTVVEWQMNRAGVKEVSLSTLMRSHLLEHESELGSKRLYLVGGTSHTMKHSLSEEYFVDFMALGVPLPSFLLRRFASPLMLEKTFLVQTLADPKLKWRRWSELPPF